MPSAFDRDFPQASSFDLVVAFLKCVRHQGDFGAQKEISLRSEADTRANRNCFVVPGSPHRQRRAL